LVKASTEKYFSNWMTSTAKKNNHFKHLSKMLQIVFGAGTASLIVNSDNDSKCINILSEFYLKTRIAATDHCAVDLVISFFFPR
jgi:hypothetical protein